MVKSMVCAMSAWKPTRLRPVHHLEQFHVAAPAMHAGPADLAFGGQPFAEALGDVAGFAEGLRRCVLVLAAGILRPFGGAGGRIDADRRRTGGFRDRAVCGRCGRLFHLGEEAAALLLVAHGGAAAGRRPDRRDQRSGAQTFGRQACRRDVPGRRRWNRCRCAAAKGTDRRRRSARHPLRRRRSDSSIVSRSMGGSESGPLPTSPGHMALWRAGKA